MHSPIRLPVTEAQCMSSDLLRRNPRWWSQTTSSLYAVNLETRPLDTAFYAVCSTVRFIAGL